MAKDSVSARELANLGWVAEVGGFENGSRESFFEWPALSGRATYHSFPDNGIDPA